MRLGIDASNLLAGGGLTHIVAFLRDAIAQQRYERIVVWAPRASVTRFPDAPDWVEYRSPEALNRSLLSRIWWTTRHLAADAAGDIDLLFVPGGLYLGRFRPFVTMCQNMLPFDREQRALFGFSGQGLRLRLLRVLQSSTFRRADRTIFLSRYARAELAEQIYARAAREPVIPHGVDAHFDGICSHYSGQTGAPLKLLYVSTLFPYKYQLEVLQAVAALKRQGVTVQLDLVGGGDPGYMDAVLARRTELGLSDDVIVHGNVAHERLPDYYRGADAFLYASGCENFPIILVEAMVTGLPMISSGKGPMTEVLGEAAVYFDPSDVDSIVAAIQAFRDMTPEARVALAAAAQQKASQYSWLRCFTETQKTLEETWVREPLQGKVE